MAFIDEIADPQIRHVFKFWLAHWRPGRLPLRKEIDPAALPPACLPHLFLYRLERDGRLRYLLVSTAIVKVLGRDNTGDYLDEVLTGRAGARRLRLNHRVVEEGMPLYFSGPAFSHTDERRRVERLMLPVSSDGKACDHVFGIARYGPPLVDITDEPWLTAEEDPAKIWVASEDDLLHGNCEPEGATG